MKVFVSWSGELSHQIALTLREWIPCVLSFVDPYVSTEDIDKGAKWLSDIVHELETTYYGILCVTRDNVNAPWLVFEAGALTKAVAKNRVSPFLFNLGPTDFSGPLTQFQATQSSKKDLRNLVQGINRAANDHEKIKEEQVDKIFDKWWPDLRSHLDRLSKDFPDATPQKRVSKQERVLDELLSLARSQQTILTCPEQLLPEYYLSQVLTARDSIVPRLNHDICEAVERMETAYAELRTEVRKVIGSKGRTKNNILIYLEKFREPLDEILSYTERWRKNII